MNGIYRKLAVVWVSIAILLLTVAISLFFSTPIRSIIPYALAVTPVTWQHGMGSGFLFAGLATLAALVAGAFPTHIDWIGHELKEGLLTYIKLSAIVIGITVGKRIQNKQH